MKADLHMHTTASDGRLSPREAIERAHRLGAGAASVTDHDSVSGLPEAAEAARALGMRFVSGIELSCYSVCEIHILGYGFVADAAFEAELAGVKELRRARNVRIGQKLAAAGVEPDIDFAADGLGRMNMARQMVEQGYARDIADAFDRYLGARGVAYVDSKRLPPRDAVKMLKSHGAFVSLAHPKKFLTDGRLELLLGGLKAYGLDGIEVYYPSHTDADIAALLALCAKHKLLPTGGSDHHGDDDRDYLPDLDPRTAKALKLL